MTLTTQEYLEVKNMFRASSRRAIRIAWGAGVLSFAVGAGLAILVISI